MQARVLGLSRWREQWLRLRRWVEAADRAVRGPQGVSRTSPSGAGTASVGPASAPSRAWAHAGPMVQAAWVQDAGQRRVLGWAHWVVVPLPVALPAAAAVGTAVPAAGVSQGGRPGPACWGAAGAACAGWRRSALGVPWTGRTAAGSASVLRAGRPGGQEASLLALSASTAGEERPYSPLGAGKLPLGDRLQVEVA